MIPVIHWFVIQKFETLCHRRQEGVLSMFSQRFPFRINYCFGFTTVVGSI